MSLLSPEGERQIQGLFNPGKLRVTGWGQSTHFGPVVLRPAAPGHLQC